MGKTDLDLEGQSLVSKVDCLTSALNELNLKPSSRGDLNSKQGDAVKEDSDKDSGHESVSDNEDEEDEGSPCMTSHSTNSSVLLSTVSENDNREAKSENDGCPSCMSSQTTKTCVVLNTVCSNDVEDGGSSSCTSIQSTKASAVLSLDSFSVDLKNRSPAANDCDTKPGNAISGDEENDNGETKDKTAALEGVKGQSKAAVVDDASEESDEDNESVVIPDVVLKTSSTGAANRFLLSTPVDDVVYQERGPCKVPRPHLVASRYNPMSAASESRDCDAYSYGGLGSPTPALTASSYYLPLTPPYSHDDVVQQDNFLDTSPFTDAEVSALQLSPTPGYNTPVYSTNHAPTPAYNEGYSPSNNLSGPSYDLSYSNCSSPPSRSEAYGFTYDTGAFELDDTSQQLGEGSLLTANYLDALDSAVAKTVGERGFHSSDDGSNSSSVRFIMDSLRCIDKTELDYILPLSLGPSHAIPDLEQELALSSDAWSEKLPPSSPSAAYADLALNSPGNDGLKFASSFDPVISEQEAKKLSKAAVKAIKKKCSTDVILHAAKRVACQRAEDLCRKDPDGDTFFMIVVCKPSDSPNFYENLFVMQQHLQKLRVCCDQPIDGGSTDSCNLCRAGPEDWRTPLSETNNAGDSVLSCAVKMGHPEEVINFLCAGVAGCTEDMRRVFDDTGRNFLAVYTNMYPVLKRFL